MCILKVTQSIFLIETSLGPVKFVIFILWNASERQKQQTVEEFRSQVCDFQILSHIHMYSCVC